MHNDITMGSIQCMHNVMRSNQAIKQSTTFQAIKQSTTFQAIKQSSNQAINNLSSNQASAVAARNCPTNLKA
jgi:hypothetical protein